MMLVTRIATEVEGFLASGLKGLLTLANSDQSFDGKVCESLMSISPWPTDLEEINLRCLSETDFLLER